MAPPTIKGETMQAWFAAAYASSAPIMIPSKVMGELMLISDVITVRSLSPPKRMSDISMESTARLGSVTDPM